MAEAEAEAEGGGEGGDETEKDALIVALALALGFYAEPGTYHAIFIYPDPPAGEFMDDFSEEHGDPFYKRAMPGARARAVLREHAEALIPLLPYDEEETVDG